MFSHTVSFLETCSSLLVYVVLNACPEPPIQAHTVWHNVYITWHMTISADPCPHTPSSYIYSCPKCFMRIRISSAVTRTQEPFTRVHGPLPKKFMDSENTCLTRGPCFPVWWASGKPEPISSSLPVCSAPSAGHRCGDVDTPDSSILGLAGDRSCCHKFMRFSRWILWPRFREPLFLH